MLRACLERHLVMLHVQNIATHGVKLPPYVVQAQARALNHISITVVSYEHAVNVWYGLDNIRTLDPGSSQYLSGAVGMWHIARMLAEGAWVHWLEY